VPFLPAQISEDSSDLFSHYPVDRPATILRNKHNVVLAVPFHVGLALPVSHGDLLPVWLIGRRSSTTSPCTPERQSLCELLLQSWKSDVRAASGLGHKKRGKPGIDEVDCWFSRPAKQRSPNAGSLVLLDCQ